MAGKSKGLEPGKTRRIIQTLHELECPYLEGLDDISIAKLIFTPSGEARLRLLEWLLERFHPQLLHQKQTNTKCSISRVQRLALCCADLQLCAVDDYELIKGTLENDREIHFLEALTGLVFVSNSHDERSISSKMAESCHFVDDLCHNSDLKSLMPTNISLVSPVIRHLCDIDSLSLGDKHSVPSLSDLSRQVSELNLKLIEKEKQLKELVETCCYAPVDHVVLFTASQSLQVLIKTLSQLLNDFTHCYNSHVKPWAEDKETDVFDSLGGHSEVLHSHLDIIAELLSGIKLIKSSSKRLNELKVASFGNKGDFCDRAHCCFQSYIDSQTN